MLFIDYNIYNVSGQVTTAQASRQLKCAGTDGHVPCTDVGADTFLHERQVLGYPVAVLLDNIMYVLVYIYLSILAVELLTA